MTDPAHSATTGGEQMQTPDKEVCGESFDHDVEHVYDGNDGEQWVCRRCGAEGWNDPSERTIMDEKNVGIVKKYDVKRVNDPEGKHDGCWFFVLDPAHDPLAREALLAYANAAEREGYGPLAGDLRARVDG